jgi:zinc transporter 2
MEFKHIAQINLTCKQFIQNESAEKLLHFLAIITSIYIVAQLTGGILANSLAIIADSGHVLTDLASFLISIYMMRIAKIPGLIYHTLIIMLTNNSARGQFSYGYLRAEFIGALFSIFIIWTITVKRIIKKIKQYL